MNKKTIIVIKPIEPPKIAIRRLPGDGAQSSIPRSINTPPPPKPKK